MLRDLNGRTNGMISGLFPERRLILKSERHTKYVHLSPLSQIGAAALVAGLLGWAGYATVSLGAAGFEAKSAEARITAERAAYVARIESLTSRGAALASDLSTAERAASKAVAKLSERHAELSSATIGARRAEADLETTRLRLASLAREHDDALEICEMAAARLMTMETELAAARREKSALSATLATLNGALGDVAEERDAASETTASLSVRVDELSSEITESAERRSRIFTRLEDAAEVSLGSLEGVFSKSGVKIDPILNEVRRERGGEGGPFIPADQIGALGGDAAAEARLTGLMTTLERVNLLRLATERIPFAEAVSGARLTSRFGYRRDPVNGRGALHTGVDLAGKRGAPIRATAAGRVTFAGRQQGYGNVVEISHGFGYETLYAHLSRIRVKKGEIVERGDRIGDMGDTGRSTGTHVHYEIRTDGEPVNPLKYIEAARNVL